MSLSSFKESLKNLEIEQPSSSIASSRLPSESRNSVSSSLQEVAASQRKPPKSSISQQLRRCSGSLDLSFSPVSPPRPPPCPLPLPHRTTVGNGSSPASAEKRNPIVPGAGLHDALADEEGDGEDEDESRRVASRHSSSDFFSSAVRGSFEPLILSSAGESPIIQVPASINCRLLEHQREGVKFLYKLYKENHGGVLGDDMGLGKTVQTIAFLVAVAGNDSENKNFHRGRILIICPTSVICNWENEFQEWSDFNVAIYHGPNRDLILDKLEARGVDALITSFDTFRIHGKVLSEIKWEIAIFDEAHRLKNERSLLYTACSEIKTKRRFGLTGTIMQNKVMELFNLVDLLSPGCFGTREHFRDFYDEPLKHGQRISAPERYIEIAEERRRQLSSVLQRYLLRRTKEETIGHLLLGKEDNVVFCSMSDLQRRVYQRMLAQPEIQCVVNKDLPCTCGSPLTRIECCHKTIPSGVIWSHLHKDRPEGCESCPFCVVLPCLVKLQQISNHLELIKPNPRDEIEKQKKDAELASAVFGADIDLVGGSAQTECFMGLSDAEHCGKMKVLDKLMSSWISSGDKVLLFSYSVRMLDILEKFLIRKGYCFSRLDGSTPMSLRQSHVDDFNRSPSRQVFLISTRAGGLGLNLVSANRVVIFDPNWNPSQDLQAQDRSFRYGQKRHVVVFRLLAAGSLEELVYTRQVYKQQLSNIAVSGKMETRYFEGVQDCKKFKGELFGVCNLFRDLSDQLFTSEIIEPFRVCKRNDGKTFHTREKTRDDDGIMEQDKGMKTEYSSQMYLDPLAVKRAGGLHDLGIVYAHRNEDIVNAGLAKISDENQTEKGACRIDKLSREMISEGADHLSADRVEISDYNHMDASACWRNIPSSMRNSKKEGHELIAVSRREIFDKNLVKESTCRREKLDRERNNKRTEFELITTSGEIPDENLVEESACLREKISRERNCKRTEYERIAAERGMGVVEFSKWVLVVSPSKRQEVLEEYYNKRKRKKRKKTKADVVLS